MTAKDISDDLFRGIKVATVSRQNSRKWTVSGGTYEIESEMERRFVCMEDTVLGEERAVERTDGVGMERFKSNAGGGRWKPSVFEGDDEIKDFLSAAFPVRRGFDFRSVVEEEGVG